MRTKSTKLEYRLGTATHIFTALPVFRSGMEAREWALARPRNGVWYVHEYRDVVVAGVVVGLDREIVSTIPAGAALVGAMQPKS